ncbi:uncharacterized protein LY79DRAFT_537469 [Colletotrichum navitas]|uniref:Uncharacterized protein n=1 Tax=Colletotrichum navitas TaxID=681940 RepID=A0AAD8QCL4_9PEZI|nr:uncharacterized protein LY79DRAFT_537469 [Colletotrichum navitas]KAK1598559.1 hypothetical protein LY79DRAFT_537469 [Colletotrichum navitas]
MSHFRITFEIGGCHNLDTTVSARTTWPSTGAYRGRGRLPLEPARQHHWQSAAKVHTHTRQVHRAHPLRETRIRFLLGTCSPGREGHPHSSLRDDPPAVVRPRGPRPRGRPGSSRITAHTWRRVVNRRSAAVWISPEHAREEGQGWSRGLFSSTWLVVKAG